MTLHLYIVRFAAMICFCFPFLLSGGVPGAAVIGGLPDFNVHAVQIQVQTLKKIRYCSLNDIAKAYGLKFVRGSTLCTLQGKNSKLTVVYNKRYGSCDGVRLSLLFAPWASSSSVWVSEMDYRNVIQPLVSTGGLRKHTVKTICIDPGHGGSDPGCRGRSYTEKNIALKISLRLRDRLRALGYRVVMTRSSDVALSLDQRSVIAQKNKSDLFISIHCNAVSNKTIRGVETFSLTPVGGASSHDSKPRYSRYNGNSYDKNGFRLAYAVQNRIVRSTGNEDRGVKHARFVVLRNTPCPSVLVETGFLSNSYDEQNLGSAVYQDKLVKSITDAVVFYHRAVKP